MEIEGRSGALWRIAPVSDCRGSRRAVTPRVLSRELKELHQRGLIHRKQYPVVPPKVEYRLTRLGSRPIPVIKQVVKWGLNEGQEVSLKKEALTRRTP